MKKIIIITVYLYSLFSGVCAAQVAKKSLAESDYKLWSTLQSEQLSINGNWLSYSLHYENGRDTLFLKNTKTLKSIPYPNGFNGQFAQENYFIVQNDKEQLMCINLKKHQSEIIENVTTYTNSREGRFLMVLQKTERENQSLIVKDWKEKATICIPNVTVYSYNAAANAIVYHSNNQLILMYLDNSYPKQIIANNTKARFSDIVWQKNGESLAYFVHDQGTSLNYYQVKEKRIFTLDSKTNPSFKSDYELYNASSFELKVADDGTKIFLALKYYTSKTSNEGIQIWNTADKSLYPERNSTNNYNDIPRLAVWYPQTAYFRFITSKKFPYATISGDQKKAILFNPQDNEPQFDRNAPINFYIEDLQTGKKKLLLENQSADESNFSVSSTGTMITYFKDKNWWIYDTSNNQHTNLTNKLGVSWEQENYDWSGTIESCGNAGFTLNDDELLLYDNYDIWLVKTDGTKATKLTNGRSQGLVYRIVPLYKENETSINYNLIQKGTFNLAKGLVLKINSSSGTGFTSWDIKKGLTTIVFDQNRNKSIKIASNKNTYSYITEHYHTPPQLTLNFKNNSKIITKSNLQQKKFNWGFSKKFTYTNSKNESLQAALIYPANYNPAIKYPMVVQVYEKLSENYNKYVNPSLYNGTGFNYTNYSTQGYFVLLPDIVKEKGKPGASAADCVLNAVKEVLENESVDPNKIGLIGHSFGAYEVNFIVTHTNRFAAAVSSSGESDMWSNYLAVAWNIGKPNGFRHEFQQTNMGTSPFENPAAFSENSPILFTKQIETPLLLWSGTEDKQVHYFQSLELHLALRRLQKTNILILYENEKHTIVKKENQIDVTRRVQQWFDFYLKNKPKPEWFATDKL